MGIRKPENVSGSHNTFRDSADKATTHPYTDQCLICCTMHNQYASFCLPFSWQAPIDHIHDQTFIVATMAPFGCSTPNPGRKFFAVIATILGM